MVVSRRGLALLALSLIVVVTAQAAPARADDAPMCRVINVDFTPGGITAGTLIQPPFLPPENSYTVPEIGPQIVMWLETTSGEYLQTIYITQQTGRYGMGNRPGRADFNSGPRWPYGRRVTTFPVWANKHGVSFPQVGFQSGTDNDLSHRFDQSSMENHYCRPLLHTGGDKPTWDAASCASPVFTDKGVFGAAHSGYPPRSDLLPVGGTDSPSVQTYKTMNQFDAVSAATPQLGRSTQVSWPIPPDLAMGDYVLFMEVALEQDFNNSYGPMNYPAPNNISYGEYGVPYRGQPSVIYSVLFTVAARETVASTDTYIGYGDPSGADGKIRLPDATITTGVPNSGASRILLTSDAGQMYRVRVDARPEQDNTPPAAPGEMVFAAAQGRDATLTFLAPGDDETLGLVRGYEVRYVIGAGPLGNENFASANELAFTGDIAPAGQKQVLTVKNLLPETEYTIAVRAFDDCHNTSKLTSATFKTAPRKIGEVDACFVATAAYGSLLANDVEMLRRFRDNLMKRSVIGELAVEAYYTFGPPVAGVVGESDLLRTTARELLTPIVARVRGLRR